MGYWVQSYSGCMIVIVVQGICLFFLVFGIVERVVVFVEDWYYVFDEDNVLVVVVVVGSVMIEIYI